MRAADHDGRRLRAAEGPVRPVVGRVGSERERLVGQLDARSRQPAGPPGAARRGQRADRLLRPERRARRDRTRDALEVRLPHAATRSAATAPAFGPRWNGATNRRRSSGRATSRISVFRETESATSRRACSPSGARARSTAGPSRRSPTSGSAPTPRSTRTAQAPSARRSRRMRTTRSTSRPATARWTLRAGRGTRRRVRSAR